MFHHQCVLEISNGREGSSIFDISFLLFLIISIEALIYELAITAKILIKHVSIF